MGAAMGWLQLREDYNGWFVDIFSEFVAKQKREATIKVASNSINIYSIVKPNISLKSLKHSSHIQYFWSAVQ